MLEATINYEISKIKICNLILLKRAKKKCLKIVYILNGHSSNIETDRQVLDADPPFLNELDVCVQGALL